ncbi:hypothetical protein OU798_07330 [Prolixibacteraceae bacterium Z1-6]|uniref:Uncharacterized protein n=1 Tax=Draconibacterium aestuarii TaxID=2998507 RepID=A0A9X3J580_9BACT|nr:hypothetical protein [Prolixibacteraceae bacterium Z1-6]
MSEHNKLGKQSNSEAVDLEIVDVSVKDYNRRSDLEHFGVVLKKAATLRVQTLHGTIGSFFFPAGWNPVALVKIFKHTDNTTEEIQVFY